MKPGTKLAAYWWRGPRFLLRYGFIIVLVLLTVAMALTAPGFLTSRNLLNLIRTISITGIAALGATFVILVGEIDLSVASTIALGGVIFASLQFVMPTMLAVILALALTTTVGFINGLITTKANVASFAVTLGSMAVVRGFALLYAHGRPIYGFKASARWMGARYVGPIPVAIIFLLIGLLVMIYVLRMTRFGRQVYAVGGNEDAAYLGGISVHKVKILAFSLASFLAGFGGIIMASRLGSGEPIAATGYEFDVIASVVIGGTSLKGGVGTVEGTLLGALLMGMIVNGLNLQGVNPYWQNIMKGLIIIIAVIIDQQKRRFR